MKTLVGVVGCVALLTLSACAADSAHEQSGGTVENDAPDGQKASAPYRYEITNVRVKKEASLVGNEPTYYIVFNAAWPGEGPPPLTTCPYTVYTQDGSRIERGRTRLAVEDGKDLEVRLEAETGVPASAEFGKCPSR